MLPKTLQKLEQHRLVDEISDERSMDSGYWIYLIPGFINKATETHFIHEDTVTECLDQIRHSIEPCDCDDCKRLLSEDPQQ